LSFSDLLNHPESAACDIIDRQLAAAGWTVTAPGSSLDGRPTARCGLAADSRRADRILYPDGKASGGAPKPIIEKLNLALIA